MYPFSDALQSMHTQMRKDVGKIPDPRYASDEKLKQSWERVSDEYYNQLDMYQSTVNNQKKITDRIAEVQKALRDEYLEEDAAKELYDKLAYLSGLLMTDEDWAGMKNRLDVKAQNVQDVQDEYDRRPWLPQTDPSPLYEGTDDDE